MSFGSGLVAGGLLELACWMYGTPVPSGSLSFLLGSLSLFFLQAWRAV